MVLDRAFHPGQCGIFDTGSDSFQHSLPHFEIHRQIADHIARVIVSRLVHLSPCSQAGRSERNTSRRDQAQRNESDRLPCFDPSV